MRFFCVRSVATLQRMRSTFLVLLVVAAPSALASQPCYDDAATRFNVPAKLLRAIAHHESRERDGIEHRNANGTIDYGRMQINSTHLAELSNYGITKETLRDDACTNVSVGAWILSRNAAAIGWSWDAVGAYNAGCAKITARECKRLRNRYAVFIDRALRTMDQPRASRRSPTQPLQLASAPAAASGLLSIELGDGNP